MEVIEGQVWQDNDKRAVRYVRVVQVLASESLVRIQSCGPSGEEMQNQPIRRTKLSRFGKTGTIGFTLVSPQP